MIMAEVGNILAAVNHHLMNILGISESRVANAKMNEMRLQGKNDVVCRLFILF